MLFVSILKIGFALGLASLAEPSALPQREGTEAAASREYFYIGGNYALTNTGGHIFTNQMYVEKLSPARKRHRYPLVFIHGQAQTGTVSYEMETRGSLWAKSIINRIG